MEITLNSIAPSATITKDYRLAIFQMMDDMRADIIRDIVKPYRSEIAMDGILEWMGHVIDSVVGKWQQNINGLSERIASDMVGTAKTHYDKRLHNMLKKRGFTVNFRNTKEVETQAQIALEENIALIKSVGNQYLDNVRAAVWRSVKNGYDLESLIKQLRHIDGVSDRRAKNIAKDQVAKLNQAFEDARAKEFGVTKAKWLHSSAVKSPRHEHVAAHGQVYEIDKGIKFSNGWFKPAQDFGCMCRKYLIIEVPESVV